MAQPQLRYGMLIQWSDEDDSYVVSFPDFGRGPMTHGATYEEAAMRGREVLEMLVDHYQEYSLPLPASAPIYEPAIRGELGSTQDSR